MATTPPKLSDMLGSLCEPATCRATDAPVAAACSTSGQETPVSLVCMVSASTEESDDSAEEATQVSVCGAAASGAPAFMEQEFEALDASGGWPQAFLEVANRCHHYPDCVARDSENRSRNRYRDVYPYDHSRVCLQAAPSLPGSSIQPGLGFGLALAVTPGPSCSFSSKFWSLGSDHGGDGDEDNDYINASFVVVEEAQRSYILTQGPLPNTCGHFWLMVWQQSSQAVIMLNRLVEKDLVKCAQYWPPCEGQSLLFEDLGISVHMLGEEVSLSHTIRFLRLENMLTGEVRAISHFHYTSWPDFGVPESPASFLTFLFMVRESGFLNYQLGPAVIHCSAGIGRSGTFALIDACLVLMEKRENPFSLNITQVLVGLRKYRMGLIQTPEQLRFSYMAVIEGAKFLMGDENVKKKWKELTKEDHARSYSFDSSPPPSGVRNIKYKASRPVLDDDDDDDDDDSDVIVDESDYSDLATRIPDSEEESSEGNTRKRWREECEASTSEEKNENVERLTKSGIKRRRLDL